MKHFIIRTLHKIFGFERYLFIFTIFKIQTLSLYKKKRAYLYFTKMFSPSSNIIVIGASTGITTIPLAKRVKYGKVFAIEPVKENYLAILEVARFYNQKNVETINYALGNENKTIEMIMPIINSTKSHGMCHIEGARQSDEGIKFDVKMKRLDDMPEFFQIKIDGIKIVVESYDEFIFKGGENLIKKNMPVIYCELWLLNENRTKTLELVTKLNYKIKVLEGDRLVDINSENEKSRFLFFIPQVKSN